ESRGERAGLRQDGRRSAASGFARNRASIALPSPNRPLRPASSGSIVPFREITGETGMARDTLKFASLAAAALALQPTPGLAQHAHIKAYPIVKTDVAHDLSPTLRSVAGKRTKSILKPDANGVVEIGPEDEPVAPNKPFR